MKKLICVLVLSVVGVCNAEVVRGVIYYHTKDLRLGGDPEKESRDSVIITRTRDRNGEYIITNVVDKFGGVYKYGNVFNKYYENRCMSKFGGIEYTCFISLEEW